MKLLKIISEIKHVSSVQEMCYELYKEINNSDLELDLFTEYLALLNSTFAKSWTKLNKTDINYLDDKEARIFLDRLIKIKEKINDG